MEVLVLFDYDGQAEDELTIRKGDVILDVRKIEGGWWEGVLGSKRGHFPDNFVMVVSEAEMDPPTPIAVVRTVKGRKCKALFSYAPSHEDELALAIGDEIQFLGEVEEGWWRGKLAGKIGVFPSNFVAIDDCSTFSTSNQEPSIPVHGCQEVVPELPPKPLKEIAKVLFPYTALQPDELDLREGDLVIIHNKDCEDKGWWKGELNNKVGVFPDNFVEILPRVLHSPGSTNTDQQRVLVNNMHTPQLRASSIQKNDSATSPSSELTTASHPPDRYAVSENSGIVNQSTHLLLHGNVSSLSDEQKLQHVGEPDMLNAIAPTESLASITASRVRGAPGRRPPSVVLLKDVENCNRCSEVLTIATPQFVNKTIYSGVITEESEQLSTSKPHVLRIKQPPWMEELKRNQSQGSKYLQTTNDSIPEKSFGLPTKPLSSKSVHSSTNQLAVKKSAQNDAKGNISNESAGKIYKNNHCSFGTTSSNSAVSPETHSSTVKSLSNTPGASGMTTLQFVDKSTSNIESKELFGIRKHMRETTGSVLTKECSTNHVAAKVVTEDAIQDMPVSDAKKQSASALSDLGHSLNQNEEIQQNMRDGVHHELKSLHLRIVSLEETVTSLQTELLLMRQAMLSQQNGCRCKRGTNGDEASLVHI